MFHVDAFTRRRRVIIVIWVFLHRCLLYISVIKTLPRSP
nr:MAG TPA: hypothetical protein [Caudoviricetes sp.]